MTSKANLEICRSEATDAEDRVLVDRVSVDRVAAIVNAAHFWYEAEK